MLNIRRAKSHDAKTVMLVHTKSVRGITTKHYTQEQLDSLAIPKPLESYISSIRDKEFYVAEEAVGVVGFGVLNQDSCEIEALFVLPEIKKGIGRQLLNKLEERARNLGIEKLSLNASLNAEDFYRRSGYEVEKKATYHLHTGVEIPCIQMVKHL